MTLDLSGLSRHCAREVRTALKELPEGGDWRLVKTKDHYFLYDGQTRVACVSGNASKFPAYFAMMGVQKIKKHVATHYARRITTENKNAHHD